MKIAVFRVLLELLQPAGVKEIIRRCEIYPAQTKKIIELSGYH
jgi:hypothetical protein